MSFLPADVQTRHTIVVILFIFGIVLLLKAFVSHTTGELSHRGKYDLKANVYCLRHQDPLTFWNFVVTRYVAGAAMIIGAVVMLVAG